MSLVSPRIVLDVSYVRRINHEINFWWHGQNMVKLECHLSWQAQHFVKVWEITGARTVVFSIQNASTRLDRSPKRRAR